MGGAAGTALDSGSGVGACGSHPSFGVIIHHLTWKKLLKSNLPASSRSSLTLPKLAVIACSLHDRCVAGSATRAPVWDAS
jgi:hypothetical protein